MADLNLFDVIAVSCSTPSPSSRARRRADILGEWEGRNDRRARKENEQ